MVRVVPWPCWSQLLSPDKPANSWGLFQMVLPEELIPILESKMAGLSHCWNTQSAYLQEDGQPAGKGGQYRHLPAPKYQPTLLKSMVTKTIPQSGTRKETRSLLWQLTTVLISQGKPCDLLPLTKAWCPQERSRWCSGIALTYSLRRPHTLQVGPYRGHSIHISSLNFLETSGNKKTTWL